MRADRHADRNTSHPCLEVKSAIFTNLKKINALIDDTAEQLI